MSNTQTGIVGRYFSMKANQLSYGWSKAKRMKVCYLFLAPYAILFFTFFISDS